MKKKIIRFTAVLLALVLLVAGGAIYQLFIFPRTDSSFLTFQPFSGKLFDLEPSELESVSVRTEGSLDWHKYVTQEDLEWAAEILNSFRYSYWVPEFRHEKEWLPAGGTCKAISIGTKDGEWVVVNFFRHDSVFVSSIWYHCDPGHFNALFRYA